MRIWRGYITWSGYAYTGADTGVEAASTFAERLKEVSVAVKNQDNREHDLFDSDDYFQEHGGMIACVRALTGKTRWPISVTAPIQRYPRCGRWPRRRRGCSARAW